MEANKRHHEMEIDEDKDNGNPQISLEKSTVKGREFEYDEDMDAVMGQLNTPIEPSTNQVQAPIPKPRKGKADPNRPWPLTTINTPREVVKNIRVVIVRKYPTLYHGFNAKGEQLTLNQRRMEKLIAEQHAHEPIPGSSSKVQPSLALPKERVMQVRGVDVADFNSNNGVISALIFLPFTKDDEIPAFEEGDIVEFTQLKAAELVGRHTKTLTRGRFTQITVCGREGLVTGNLSRHLSVAESINNPDFNPVFWEFDYCGVVCQLGVISEDKGQKIKFVDQNGKSLWIKFPHSMEEAGLLGVVEIGNVVGLQDVAWRKDKIFETNRTDIHLEPEFGIFKVPIERLKIDVEWMNGVFFKTPPGPHAYANPENLAPQTKKVNTTKSVIASVVQNLKGKRSNESKPNLREPKLTEAQKEVLKGLKDIKVPKVAAPKPKSRLSRWDRFTKDPKPGQDRDDNYDDDGCVNM